MHYVAHLVANAKLFTGTPAGILQLTGRLQENLAQCPAPPDPKGAVAVPGRRPFRYIYKNPAVDVSYFSNKQFTAHCSAVSSVRTTCAEANRSA